MEREINEPQRQQNLTTFGQKYSHNTNYATTSSIGCHLLFMRLLEFPYKKENICKDFEVVIYLILCDAQFLAYD